MTDHELIARAECQQYDLPDEPYFTGLLPDSFQLSSQLRCGPYINASAIHYLRYLIDGRATNLTVLDVAGRRVVSPYPARAEENKAIIDAPKGSTYQLLIDGRELKTIESQGRDVVEL